MSKALAIGGTILGIALVGTAGYLIFRSLKGRAVGVAEGAGNVPLPTQGKFNPYAKLGLTPGIEIGASLREDYVEYIRHEYALQLPRTSRTLTSSPEDQKLGKCLKCLGYNRDCVKNPAYGSGTQCADWVWWNELGRNPTYHAITKAMLVDTLGCDPTEPADGNYDCLLKYAQLAEGFKRQCPDCITGLLPIQQCPDPGWHWRG